MTDRYRQFRRRRIAMGRWGTLLGAIDQHQLRPMDGVPARPINLPAEGRIAIFFDGELLSPDEFNERMLAEQRRADRHRRVMEIENGWLQLTPTELEGRWFE